MRTVTVLKNLRGEGGETMKHTSVILNKPLLKTTTLPKDYIQISKETQEKPFRIMLENERGLNKSEKTEDQLDVRQEECQIVEDTLVS